jgi:MoaA/NifB/PqqE/SkfB family radical SAM enzyme
MSDVIHPLRKRIKSLVLKPSYLCNQACIMCPHTDTRSAAYHMSTEEFLKTLAELKTKYHPGRVELVGGEPTVYPDFLKILQWFADCWPEVEVHVYTNGVKLADATLAQKLARYRVIVDIALHGPSEEVNAEITGRTGQLTRVRSALSILSDLNVNMNATVAVMKQNENSLKELNALISLYAFRKVSYRLPILAREEHRAFMPDISQFVQNIRDSLKTLRKDIQAEIIMIPRCFDPLVCCEDGDVVLVDRSVIENGGRLRQSYDNSILNNFAEQQFKKEACCRTCRYDSSCTGLDAKYLERLHGTGRHLVPVTE